MKRVRVLSTIWAIFIAFCLIVTPVLAHGGGTSQLINAIAGPYRVSLWTQPEPLQPGTVHFTVAVTAPPAQETDAGETGPSILDASVNLHVTPLDEPGQAIDLAATRTAANTLHYEADTVISAEGNWQVVIQVAGPKGEGQASVTLLVGVAQGLNWGLMAGIFFVMMVILMGLFQRRRVTANL